jgi:Uma2 family endonuclease
MARPTRTRQPATYEDLLNVPDHLVAEILDGDLYTTPRPAPRHADASSGSGAALRGPFDRGRGGPGGWRILDEPEWHLASDVLVPDLAGWRRERLPRLPEEAFFSLAPDWICEVLSPATAAIDRVKKLSIYGREGVPHAWLVDPNRSNTRGPSAARWTLDDRLHVGRSRHHSGGSLRGDRSRSFTPLGGCGVSHRRDAQLRSMSSCRS